jgi:hypothetical protein
MTGCHGPLALLFLTFLVLALASDASPSESYDVEDYDDYDLYQKSYSYDDDEYDPATDGMYLDEYSGAYEVWPRNWRSTAVYVKHERPWKFALASSSCMNLDLPWS